MKIDLAKSILSIPDGWIVRPDKTVSWQTAIAYDSPDGDKTILIFNDGSRMFIDVLIHGKTGKTIINPNSDIVATLTYPDKKVADQ